MTFARRTLIASCLSAAAILSPSLHAALAEPAALGCKEREAQQLIEAIPQPPVLAGGQVTQTVLAGVPAIVRMPQVISKPPIILWHGFGPPASERALMEALPLDDVPAMKVYLGLPMFGERATARGMAELAERQEKDIAMLVFAPVVAGAADELSSVVGALVELGCVRPHEGIGLFGFSAGGASVLLALADRRVEVKAAVTLNASTGLSASVRAFERATQQAYRWKPESRLLANRTDAVNRAADISAGTQPPALLVIHGESDPMLPAQISRDLHQALLPHYEQPNADSRLQLVIAPSLAHTWVGAEIEGELHARISQWFGRYL